MCRTDKDCKGELECFLSGDIIEDDSERAAKFHGQCFKPSKSLKHCKKSTDCSDGYECVASKEIHRGTCEKKEVKVETAPMHIDFVKKLSSEEA